MVNQPVNTRSSHGSNVGDQSLMFGTNPLVNHGINPPRKLIGPGFLFGIKEVVYESCCQLVQKLGKKNRIYVCIYSIDVRCQRLASDLIAHHLRSFFSFLNQNQKEIGVSNHHLS